MKRFSQHTTLSMYNKHILIDLLRKIDTDQHFNIYKLIEDAVFHNCILPSQNYLVMETYCTLTEFLVSAGFIDEKEEMSLYRLTKKGNVLRSCGSLDKYEEYATKRNISGFFRSLFLGNKFEITQPNHFMPQ